MVDPLRLYRELTPLRHLRRFAQHSLVAPISVLEHSALVALLGGAMAAQLQERGVVIDRAAVIEGGLWHDAAEAVVTDIPASTKWMYPRLAEALAAAEDNVLLKLAQDAGCPGYPLEGPVPPSLTIERLVVKVADAAELCLYVQEEQAAGNQTIDHPRQAILEFLRTGWLALRIGERGGELEKWYEETVERLQESDGARSSRLVFGRPQ